MSFIDRTLETSEVYAATAVPVDSYPVMRKLGNGASVADWLGTARVAAGVAAHEIERVRTNKTSTPILSLDRAEAELEQALEEIRFVREQVEGIRHTRGGIDHVTRGNPHHLGARMDGRPDNDYLTT